MSTELDAKTKAMPLATAVHDTSESGDCSQLRSSGMKFLPPKISRVFAKRRRRQGFTLLELVIVVLVMGILAAVATPKYSGAISQYRLEAAAKRVAADLERARRNAKTTGKNQAVDFTLATNSYDLPGIKDMDHPSLDYTVDLSATQYPGSLVSVDFDGNTSVTFDMYGRPFSGGSPLSSGTVVIAVDGQQRTISVNATTGKASVQ